jgi:hypothetical protein
MHPSEWAKAIYQKQSRRDVAFVLGLVALVLALLWLAHFIKSGEWF